jgi:hypothetical protein
LGSSLAFGVLISSLGGPGLFPLRACGPSGVIEKVGLATWLYVRGHYRFSKDQYPQRIRGELLVPRPSQGDRGLGALGPGELTKPSCGAQLPHHFPISVGQQESWLTQSLVSVPSQEEDIMGSPSLGYRRVQNCLSRLGRPCGWN